MDYDHLDPEGSLMDVRRISVVPFNICNFPRGISLVVSHHLFTFYSISICLSITEDSSPNPASPVGRIGQKSEES